MKETPVNDAVLVELNVPLFLLCQEGSKLRVRISTQYDSKSRTTVRRDYSILCYCCGCLQNDNFSTKLTIPLEQDVLKIVDFNYLSLFRPTTRSLLTYYLLNSPEAFGDAQNSKLTAGSNEGLNYMIKRGYLEDAFLYHEYESDQPELQINVKQDDDSFTINSLYRAWSRRLRFQPVNMIRNYFGEHIAMYFAWCDVLTMFLWIPILFGLASAYYGFFFYEAKSAKNSNRTSYDVNSLVEMFDNELMPAYAAVISLWGTAFLELWKRQNARLVYLWDIKSFENREPDRPEYRNKSTFCKSYWIRYGISSFISLSMVCLVLFFTILGTLYRLFVRVKLCRKVTKLTCSLASDVVASLFTSVSVIVLENIYSKVAVSLTKWENYRTATEFQKSLILKLFAFYFANSYSTCIYLAFFRVKYRNGMFGLGAQYNDVCEDNFCMPLLSMQVMTLMLARPLPKFFGDFLLPYLKDLWNKCRKSEISDKGRLSRAELEYRKNYQNDFTTSEYAEKVVLYGYLMLFASSFPFAPIVAFVTISFDMKLDAKRLSFLYRRPIPFISEDIGTWFMILEILNAVGVLVNASVIAFTSKWGTRFNMTQKLLFILVFQNSVMALRRILSFIIPDIPKSVKMARRLDLFTAVKINRQARSKSHLLLNQEYN